jgi:tungstate transport system substrate-binding protein
MPTRRTLFSLAIAAVLAGTAIASAQDKSIVVSSTTSTQDSGLFGYILPLFKTKTGITVRVVSQGTDQALDTGQRGDAAWCSFTPSRRRRNLSPTDSA